MASGSNTAFQPLLHHNHVERKKVINNLHTSRWAAGVRVTALWCAAWTAVCPWGTAQAASSVEPNPASNAPAIITRGSAEINTTTRNNTKSTVALTLAQ